MPEQHGQVTLGAWSCGDRQTTSKNDECGGADALLSDDCSNDDKEENIELIV